MSKKKKLLAGAAVGGFAALAAGCSYLYRFAFIRPNAEEADVNMRSYENEIKKEKEWLAAQELEQVSIKSRDGLKLNGYYLPCENAVRTIVCVNGFRGNGKKDFLMVSRFYHEHGSSILMIDQRGCGLSEGEMCFGVMGRYDCISWLQYLVGRLGDEMPLYLDGVSMGAATVLMASELDLPENVKGIIADCGYTTPWEIMKYASNHIFHLPAFPMLPITNFVYYIRNGYSMKDASATEAVKNSKVPILFVHGAADDFVPTEMSRVNYEACKSPKHIEIIEGAAHAMSYMVEKEHCEEVILKFFEVCENGDHDGFFAQDTSN